MPDHIAQLRTAMDAVGVVIRAPIPPDGKIHRYHVEGDRRGSRNGWVVYHDDGVPAAAFGSYRSGIKSKWSMKGATPLTVEERRVLAAKAKADRAAREAEDARRAAVAAVVANKVCNDSPPATEHDYLLNKKIGAHGARIATWKKERIDPVTGEVTEIEIPNALIIPIKNSKREIVSLQAIFKNDNNPLGRNKDYLSGGAKRGCFNTIGAPAVINGRQTLIIAEGFSTSASLYEATGIGTVIAFDAGNLLPVAQEVRRLMPNAVIILAADDDSKTKGNPGVTNAKTAAQAVGGIVVIPSFTKRKPGWSDFNDLAVAEGLDAVKVQILKALGSTEVPTPDQDVEPNVLEGLVERTSSDPGIPFTPEVVEKLAVLKRSDRAAFESLRSQLKKCGCRVTVLDREIAKASGEADTSGQTQSDILIELAAAAEVFHTPDGTGYADVTIRGHRETWQIRSKGFKQWLTHSYFEAKNGAPGSEALQSALNAIEAKARFEGPQRAVHVRIGGCEGRIYIDLGDDGWSAVEIDAAGWRLINNPPVRFRRAAGTLPLPEPVRGGSIDALRPFVNVGSQSDFVLVIAWILACLRDCGPYPVLVLSGEQGSAKSSFSKLLRGLTDPNTAPLRSLPREDRDMFISANNAHVLVFDNVSNMPVWISDTLCRLATGGGFSVRQLYSDGDEVLFDASRPVILNGIEGFVTRPDLASRALVIRLDAITEDRRRTDQDLKAAFEIEGPRILGALLDAVAHGIAALPETHLDRFPRMADFALWVSACEPNLWARGTFMSAYSDNQQDALGDILDADPVSAALVELVRTQRTMRTYTATSLLGALKKLVGDEIVKGKTWPTSPRALSERLRRVAPTLRSVGIEIEYCREGHERTRTIRFSVQEGGGMHPSASSASSAGIENGNSNNTLPAGVERTMDGADADERPFELEAIVRTVSCTNAPTDLAAQMGAVDPAGVGGELNAAF